MCEARCICVHVGGSIVHLQCICMAVELHVHVYTTCKPTPVFLQHALVIVQTCMYTHKLSMYIVSVCVHVHVCTCVCILMCVGTCVCVCVCPYLLYRVVLWWGRRDYGWSRANQTSTLRQNKHPHKITRHNPAPFPLFLPFPFLFPL